MARKQTLADILGTSDRRVQTNLDLGQVSLSPKIQQARGTNVIVPSTPKTDAALEFATALESIPAVFAKGAEQAQAEAMKEVASVDDVEAAMLNNDKQTSNILGYEKMFQRGLVQRYIKQNEPAIVQRFMNLANDPENLKLDNGQFLSKLEDQQNNFVDELLETYGGNPYRTQAIEALGGSLLDNLTSKVSESFIANKKYQAISNVDTNFSDNLKTLGFTEAANVYRSEFTALGFLAPKEIETNLVNAIKSDVTVKIEQGSFNEARALVDEASKYELYSGAVLGKKRERAAEFSALNTLINEAEERKDEEFNDNSKGVKRFSDRALESIANPNLDPQTVTEDIKSVLVRAGISEESADTYLAELPEKVTVLDYINVISKVSRETENNQAEELLADQLSSIRYAKNTYFSGGASSIGSFSDTDVSELEADIRTALDQNPYLTKTQLPITAGGRKMNYADPQYTEMLERVLVDYAWARVPSQKDTIIKTAQTFIKGKESSYTYGELAGEYSTAIANDINEIAPQLWAESKGNVSIYNELLQDKATQIEKTYRTEAVNRNRVEDLLVTDLIPKSEEEAEKKGYKRATKEGFKSLTLSNSDISMGDVVNDRLLIMASNLNTKDKLRVIRYSLKRHGFYRTEDIDLKLLSDAGMGFQDVKFGDRVLKDMLPALDGYRNKDSGEEVTEEQQKSMDYWFETFGFDSLADFETFEQQQTTLRKLRSL